MQIDEIQLNWYSFFLVLLTLYVSTMTLLAWLKPNFYLQIVALTELRKGKDPVLGKQRALTIGRYWSPIGLVLFLLMSYVFSLLM